MKPLICDALWTTQPSRTEQWLLWLPIIGWTIAAALEQVRFHPMVRNIEQQLRERPDTSNLWGANPRRRELSRALRTILQQEIGWPNDHFIPDDPLGIACWGHKDGCDRASALMRIEKEFGFQPPESEWERLWLHGTVGELIDQLIANDRNG